ncbi:MAG: hypothetical protein P8Z70_11880, partial [Desulfuromonadales bacterium]
MAAGVVAALLTLWPSAGVSTRISPLAGQAGADSATTQASPVASGSRPEGISAVVGPDTGATKNGVQASPGYTTFIVRPGDTLSALFERAGLDKSEYLRVMALGAVVNPLRVLHPGDRIRLRIKGAQGLAELGYTEDPLHTHQNNLQPSTEKTSVSDVVNENLSVALQRAGLSASKVAEFVKIFHWRVDFRRDIRRGTRFSVVYNRRHVGNRELSPGPIVAAELVLHDRTLRAFRFSDAHGEAGYYDDRGASMHPTLLRTPVHYTRVSSSFSRRRFNPVVHVWRPHWGVDLA